MFSDRAVIMPAASSSTQLLESLQRHNDTFESLLKLIPAKFYLVNDDSNDFVPSKYQKHTGKKAKDIKAAKRERVRFYIPCLWNSRLIMYVA